MLDKSRSRKHSGQVRPANLSQIPTMLRQVFEEPLDRVRAAASALTAVVYLPSTRIHLLSPLFWRQISRCGPRRVVFVTHGIHLSLVNFFLPDLLVQVVKQPFDRLLIDAL